VRAHRWLLIAAVILGAIAGAASGFGAPFFMQKVFSRFFETPEAYSLTAKITIAVLLPAVFLVRGASVFFNQYFLNLLGQRVLFSLRLDLFRKLQALSLAYFDRQKTGDLISRLVSDTTNIQHTIMLVSKEVLLYPFIFLGGLSYLIFLSVREREAGFILLLFAIIPVLVLPVRYIGRNLKHRGRQLQDAIGETTNQLSESLQAVMEIRAFNLQQRQTDRYSAHLARTVVFHMKMMKYYLLSQPMMEVMAVTVISGAFLYAAASSLSFSIFISMGGALYFTIDSVKRLIRMLNDVQRTEGAFHRIEEILDEDECIRDPDTPKTLAAVRGLVEFRHVRFGYDEHHALDGINVTIAPGTHCALVGPSGAGKTTFAKLIPRFYDPNEGAVLIDGIDLRELRRTDLRAHIAMVPQMPVLFNDTVANNIRISKPEATDAEIEAAARAAFAHEFIERLPDGYATEVGENALRLSGGQRQRLALARAFLKNAPILILDEATSALDSESELKIQAALEKLIVGKTVFVIAHRFSTIQQADRVLLFEDGRITGDGTISELFEHPVFRKLYENQQLK